MFVKRHQIAKEEDGSPLTPADLSVGHTVTVYGRTFFVVDADTFTRNWYAQQLGVDLAAPGTYPADPVEAYRNHFGLNTAPSECECVAHADTVCMHVTIACSTALLLLPTPPA